MPLKFPRRRRLLLLRFVTLPMLDAAASKPNALGEEVEEEGDRILSQWYNRFSSLSSFSRLFRPRWRLLGLAIAVPLGVQVSLGSQPPPLSRSPLAMLERAVHLGVHIFKPPLLRHANQVYRKLCSLREGLRAEAEAERERYTYHMYVWHLVESTAARG